MDIDKLIQTYYHRDRGRCFSSLMDIDKLILSVGVRRIVPSFSSLMDIDKLIPKRFVYAA